MKELASYAHDLLLLGVIVGLAVDGAGKERMHRLADFFTRIGQNDDLYRAALELHQQQVKSWEASCAAAEKAWETHCLKEQPDKWRTKLELEADVAELERRCRSLEGADAPCNYDREPFIGLEHAERKLFNLVQELNPPDFPLRPPAPTPSALQPIRSLTFAAAFISFGVLTVYFLKSRPDGFILPLDRGNDLWAGALYLGAQLGSVLALCVLFMLASLASRTASLCVGYLAAKTSNGLGLLLSRPRLHLFLRVVAWLEVAWSVWSRMREH